MTGDDYKELIRIGVKAKRHLRTADCIFNYVIGNAVMSIRANRAADYVDRATSNMARLLHSSPEKDRASSNHAHALSSLPKILLHVASILEESNRDGPYNDSTIVRLIEHNYAYVHSSRIPQNLMFSELVSELRGQAAAYEEWFNKFSGCARTVAGQLPSRGSFSTAHL